MRSELSRRDLHLSEKDILEHGPIQFKQDIDIVWQGPVELCNATTYFEAVCFADVGQTNAECHVDIQRSLCRQAKAHAIDEFLRRKGAQQIWRLQFDGFAVVDGAIQLLSRC